MYLNLIAMKFLCIRRIGNRNVLQKSHYSFWSKVKLAPPDPIFGVTEAFDRDDREMKVNLGAGAYRDNEGKPFKLKCVKKAEEIILKQNLNKEYLPITGHAGFIKKATELAFGTNCKQIKEGRSVSLQSLSGTGGLSLLAQFLGFYMHGNKTIFVSNPTWGNHSNIFKTSGLKVAKYTYYHAKTKSLNFKGMLADIAKIPKRSIILLHARAHNPTGVDPKKEQWPEISKAIKKRNLLVFFDLAYQGFATGDFDNDAYAPRLFLEDNHEMVLAQSFSKNMGLYGERIGTANIFFNDPADREKILSQMKRITRANYSNPNLQGARIVNEVLSNSQLRALYMKEVKMMATRVIAMREALKKNLIKAGSKKNWDHITDQIGMFCYTGVNPDQVKAMGEKHGVYMTNDGRISCCCLAPINVEHVAKAFHDVTK